MRAEQDLRRLNAAFHDLVARLRRRGWESPALGDWTGAETCLHVLLVMEQAFEEVRTLAARGLPHDRFKATVTQRLGWHLMQATWRLPQEYRLGGRCDPAGIIPDPEGLLDRSARCSAGYLRLLRAETRPFLERMLTEVPRVGLLDPLDRARFLLIYLRHCDLRIPRSADEASEPESDIPERP